MTFEMCKFLFDTANARSGENFVEEVAGRQMIIIQSIEGADHVLRKNAKNYTKALDSFRHVMGGASRITEDGENWRIRERVSQPYLAHFDRAKLKTAAERWGEILGDQLIKNQPEQRLSQFMLDQTTIAVLCDALLDGALVEQLFEMTEDVRAMIDYAGLYAFAKPAGRLSIPSDKTRQLAFHRKRMMKRLSDLRNSKMAEGSFLAALRGADRHPHGKLGFKQEVMFFLAAGSDTSAAGLGWCIELLAEHPAVQEVLRSEVRDALRHPSTDHRGPYQSQVLGEFLKEAFRLYPPVPLITRSAKSQDLIDGVEVKAGDYILISIVGINRNSRLWHDPDQMIIDRKLRFNEGLARAIPFSMGSRVCGGKRFAEIEIKTLLATLLNRLKFEPSGAEPGPYIYQVSMKREKGHPVSVAQAS